MNNMFAGEVRIEKLQSVVCYSYGVWGEVPGGYQSSCVKCCVAYVHVKMFVVFD